MTPAALAALVNGDGDNFIAAITPGGIEAQEKAGQTTFVANSTLPKETNGCSRADFEKMGFKFGEDVDKNFVSVTMPAGWKKAATSHSMWSDLLDDKGRKRAGIFYKAAFYDCHAHISLNRRFAVSAYEPVNNKGEPVEYGKHTHYAVVAKDCDQEIHRIGLCERTDYAASDELVKQGEEWLAKSRPDWKDATAYWD